MCSIRLPGEELQGLRSKPPDDTRRHSDAISSDLQERRDRRSAVGGDHGRRHRVGHCRAPTFADTDWRRIAELYDTLDRIAPSPLHALNRAVAEAYLHGPQAGLGAWPPFFRKTFPPIIPGGTR